MVKTVEDVKAWLEEGGFEAYCLKVLQVYFFSWLLNNYIETHVAAVG